MADVQSPVVYVIILNWNSAQDTIECLESLLRSDYKNFRVVVCDNGSSDGSIRRIRQWAEDQALTVAVYCRHEIEREVSLHDDVCLVLLDNKENMGFAAGNNVGIRYALYQEDVAYVWLLNNDTVVDKHAMRSLVRCMEKDEKIGIAGSKLLDYASPHKIQALAGRVDDRFAKASLITDPGEIDRANYIVGASFMIRKACIEICGLLPEEYFLYWEETDYCFRAQRHGFRLSVALDSIVYHKEGSATGVSRDPAKKSEFSDLLMIRNRIIFSRKYGYPMYWVSLGVIVSAVLRFKRGQFLRALKILRMFFITTSYTSPSKVKSQ